MRRLLAALLMVIMAVTPCTLAHANASVVASSTHTAHQHDDAHAQSAVASQNVASSIDHHRMALGDAGICPGSSHGDEHQDCALACQAFDARVSTLKMAVPDVVKVTVVAAVLLSLGTLTEHSSKLVWKPVRHRQGPMDSVLSVSQRLRI